MRLSVSRLLTCMALTLAPVAFAAPADADPARRIVSSWTGVWRNTNNTVHIKAAPCGTNMCATVVWADDKTKATVAARNRNIIGMQLLRDFRESGPSEWKGTVYVPDRDMTVSGTITLLDRNTLRAVGCFLAMFARRGTGSGYPDGSRSLGPDMVHLSVAIARFAEHCSGASSKRRGWRWSAARSRSRRW